MTSKLVHGPLGQTTTDGISSEFHLAPTPKSGHQGGSREKPHSGASSASEATLGALCSWSQHFCNHSSAIIATSELTRQLHHLFHQQLFPTSHKRSPSPHGSGICSVVEAGREVLKPFPQQERRKGQTEAQLHGLVQTTQKPQFSGAGCCTA